MRSLPNSNSALLSNVYDREMNVCLWLVQAVVMVLESTGDTALQMMVKLLKVFWQTGLITLDQMNRVCARSDLDHFSSVRREANHQKPGDLN